MLRRFWRWFVGAAQAEERVINARIRSYDAIAARNAKHVRGPLFCERCRQPLKMWTLENDYVCEAHGFVNAVRADGAILAGDGSCGTPRVIGHC